jgi:sec-independent protein translocase protein TatA
MNIGGTELLLILVIVVLMFGANKIPDLAKGLGSGIRDFKQSMKNDETKLNDEKKSDTTKV